ncbi:NAD(P)H:quinone oxidoreductase [Cupriavidus consociatus]|uniref:NAD(P)H:quinone oxidoreductase n=1 Tax=Cupriavidus consociatus TaxID=2821357 RepID=UPI001AE0F218|nr:MULTISPECIES: NAD(P)H:quinone oxidoreductase [unclassified Cupriavidus]MBP0619299.1 NAD(P)H:quinone oxidoreductase [Cupriavidus sp. LEh25]MDK2655947.1 NAD(P)H:quinone oxidoreductase [Cupriavidus sp. LEh21]
MRKPKVLIVFYSRNSSTEMLAKAVAEGALEAGAELRVRRVREFVGPDVMRQAPGWLENATEMNAKYEAPTEADAEWADAIVFGTPTRFGTISAELKSYIDGLGGLWFAGKLNGKVGSVFGTTSSRHGGNEATLLAAYTPMAHLGLIIVPLGYADAAMFKAGTPYGATHVSQRDTVKPDDDHLEVARFQGRRVTTVARALHVQPEPVAA